jgi:hypothetical protein
MKKKAIECEPTLGGCGAVCIEVGRVLGYPKPTQQKRTIALGTNGKREIGGHEYRYLCPKCGKEWLHDTLFNIITKIKSSQFQIKSINGEEFYKTEEPNTLKHYKLESGKLYTAKQLKEAVKNLCSIKGKKN